MQKPLFLGICLAFFLASCAGLQRQNLAYVPPDPETKKVVWVDGRTSPEPAVPIAIQDAQSARAAEEIRQIDLDRENIAGEVILEPSKPLTQDYQVIAQAQQQPQRSVALVDNASEKNLRAVHTVKRGETVYSISQKYAVDAEHLSRANNLTNNLILVGQILAIPTAEPFQAPTNQGQGRQLAVVEEVLRSTQEQNQSQKPWISPFANYAVEKNFTREGSYMQRYVILNSLDNQVQAMRAGKVVFVGEFEDFDSMVIIEHDQGFVSIYGNMVEGGFRVNLLQEVKQGDILGRAVDGNLKLLVQKTGDEPTNPLDLIK